MAIDGKTVLFAWELGEGLGHLPALKAIACALKAEGATTVFALREAVQTRAPLSEIGGMVLPAPFWPTPAPPPIGTGTYADILIGNGYSTRENARALISAWDQIIDLVKPDLVVCEHAPSAALSAFHRIPVAFVGNGFVVPPSDGAEFPQYRTHKGEAQGQRPALTIIQEALRDLGREAPATICEPFRGAFRGIYSFPELDTYRHVRREPLLGPIEPVPALTPLPKTRSLFAYSAADSATVDEIIQALMDIGAEASAYFRGSLGARAGVLRSRGINVHDTAPSLTTVLADAGVVFSHGGTGFTNAAFAAGRPQIVNPRHFEAESTARALEELGVGIRLQPFDGKRFREAVRRLNDDAKMRNAAQEAGAVAQRFVSQMKPLETTLVALRQMLS